MDSNWQHKVVSNILLISLDEKLPNNSFVWLNQLAQEFAAEGLTSFSFEQLDRILYSRLCTAVPNIPCFDYLLLSWKRCSDAISKNQGASSADAPHRLTALNSLKSLLVSYCSLVLNPELNMMFPQDQT